MATREAVEALPPDDTFKGVYIETYRGYKIRIKKSPREWGALEMTIGGESLGRSYGRYNEDVLREAKSARAYIDMSHERPEDFTWSRPPLDWSA